MYEILTQEELLPGMGVRRLRGLGRRGARGIVSVPSMRGTALMRVILECVSENSLPIHQEFITDSSRVHRLKLK